MGSSGTCLCGKRKKIDLFHFVEQVGPKRKTHTPHCSSTTTATNDKNRIHAYQVHTNTNIIIVICHLPMVSIFSFECVVFFSFTINKRFLSGLVCKIERNEHKTLQFLSR